MKVATRRALKRHRSPLAFFVILNIQVKVIDVNGACPNAIWAWRPPAENQNGTPSFPWTHATLSANCRAEAFYWQQKLLMYQRSSEKTPITDPRETEG